MKPRTGSAGPQWPARGEARPALYLRAVAFVEPEEGFETVAAQAVAAGGGETLQVMHRLVIAAFESAADCVSVCRGLPDSTRAGASCGDMLYEDGLMHGLPVIEASRLKDAAGPGQLLCAARLFRLSGMPTGQCRDRGDLSIKGFPEPLPVVELRRS